MTKEIVTSANLNYCPDYGDGYAQIVFQDNEMYYKYSDGTMKKAFVRKWYNFIYRWQYNICNVLSPIQNIRRIKFLFQRITRGFDNSELWSLDYSLAKLILPRLKAFKLTKRLGCPILDGFNGETDFKEMCEEWEKVLDKMILAFEAVLNPFDEVFFNKYSLNEETKPIYEKMRTDEANTIKEGMELFVKYFRNLWD